MTRNWKAFALSAAAVPMRPRPTMPKVWTPFAAAADRARSSTARAAAGAAPRGGARCRGAATGRGPARGRRPRPCRSPARCTHHLARGGRLAVDLVVADAHAHDAGELGEPGEVFGGHRAPHHHQAVDLGAVALLELRQVGDIAPHHPHVGPEHPALDLVVVVQLLRAAAPSRPWLGPLLRDAARPSRRRCISRPTTAVRRSNARRDILVSQGTFRKFGDADAPRGDVDAVLTIVR